MDTNPATRTNIVINDGLMRDAMEASGARTKREAVELGLRTLVQLKQQEGLRAFRGKLRWEGDLAALRLDRSDGSRDRIGGQGR